MGNVFDLGFGVTEREIAVDRLPVKGAIPNWLRGKLIRNGPGAFRVGETRYRHWFDGLAMLHRFSFDAGKVGYVNRFLNCQSYRAAQAAGTIAASEFATDPDRTLFQRAGHIFAPQITDSAKVNVARMGGRTLALVETPIQVAFDPDTLETQGVFTYEENRVGQMTTVHPQFDPGNATAYNLVIRYHQVSHYRIYAVAPTGAVQRVAELPVREPGYMHSFGMSPHTFIVTEFPLVVQPLRLLLWLQPYIENFRWKPRRGATFHVLRRETGERLGRYETDAFFAFHHVNAFEQGDELIVDLVGYPDAGILRAYYLDRLTDPASELPWGTLQRFRMPLKGGKMTREVLSDVCMELPRYDEARYNTSGDYRYVYAVSLRPDRRTGFYNQLVKVDIVTGTSLVWFEEDCYPGEAVFAGRPGRSAEDDGVILSVVLDATRETSFLLILDAASFTERARIELPHPILFGYHGAFFEELGLI